MIPDKTEIVVRRQEVLNGLDNDIIIVKCPYIVDCNCKYRDIKYCNTTKHLKCEEYQANMVKKKNITKWWG